MVSVLAVAACGGSEGPVSSESQHDYSNTVVPRYSTPPYKTLSYVQRWAGSDAIDDPASTILGADVLPKETLSHVSTTDGIRLYMGATRDGVGVARLNNYLRDLRTSNGTDLANLAGNGFFPFAVAPDLVFDADLENTENADLLAAIWDSVAILNDALPPEFQIEVFRALSGYTVALGDIAVHLESPTSSAWRCGTGAVACATNTISGTRTQSAEIWLPDDLDTADYWYMRSTIVHELLHALGILGHVDSFEFPDSIMGTAGETIPNIGYIISKIDREVLQIMYMSQKTATYNDWGEWSDLSHHLMGETVDGALRWGVALFNGLPQPWAAGRAPRSALSANTALSGTATWNGSLVGYSGPSPLLGNAELAVNIANLGTATAEHDLRFRDIFYVNRFGSTSADRWFHTRNIDYKVTIHHNAFYNVTGTGYEQGIVTGEFFGRSHEHMGGTVKRTDLVGAFGGSR